MNIAAVYAALELEGLDPRTKAAAIALAARAHRDGTVKVGLDRLAADLGVSRSTACRARQKLIAAKFIIVEKTRPGAATIWRLGMVTSATGPKTGCTSATEDCTSATNPAHSYDPHEESEEKSFRGAATPSPNGEASPETVKAARVAARANLNGKHT